MPSTSPEVLSAGMDVDIKARFNIDRYLGDVLVLPYNYSDIKIKSKRNSNCRRNSERDTR